MTRPETCNHLGGAISVWVKMSDCPPGDGGIISSFGQSTGSRIYCYGGDIRYDTHVFPISSLKLKKCNKSSFS